MENPFVLLMRLLVMAAVLNCVHADGQLETPQRQHDFGGLVVRDGRHLGTVISCSGSPCCTSDGEFCSSLKCSLSTCLTSDYSDCSKYHAPFNGKILYYSLKIGTHS